MSWASSSSLSARFHVTVPPGLTVNVSDTAVPPWLTTLTSGPEAAVLTCADAVPDQLNVPSAADSTVAPSTVRLTCAAGWSARSLPHQRGGTLYLTVPVAKRRSWRRATGAPVSASTNTVQRPGTDA